MILEIVLGAGALFLFAQSRKGASPYVSSANPEPTLEEKASSVFEDASKGALKLVSQNADKLVGGASVVGGAGAASAAVPSAAASSAAVPAAAVAPTVAVPGASNVLGAGTGALGVTGTVLGGLGVSVATAFAGAKLDGTQGAIIGGLSSTYGTVANVGAFGAGKLAALTGTYKGTVSERIAKTAGSATLLSGALGGLMAATGIGLIGALAFGISRLLGGGDKTQADAVKEWRADWFKMVRGVFAAVVDKDDKINMAQALLASAWFTSGYMAKQNELTKTRMAYQFRLTPWVIDQQYSKGKVVQYLPALEAQNVMIEGLAKVYVQVLNPTALNTSEKSAAYAMGRIAGNVARYREYMNTQAGLLVSAAGSTAHIALANKGLTEGFYEGQINQTNGNLVYLSEEYGAKETV